MDWSAIFLVLGAVALLFLVLPGLKASIERSREVESNWPAVVLPLVALVVFVLFLIWVARS